MTELQQCLHNKEIKLTLDDASYDFLAKVGYDPAYGVRPLKRAIQQELENPLAQAILAGKFLPGDTIQVSQPNNCLSFVK
ncbi:MAG: hypothetical protein JKY13_01175 [Gammaproteobacteria bacterium]|nr:hypothetical protein [Gammaproteobacteria bacterium]